MMCEWRQKLFGATHDQPHRPASISWNYFLLLVGTDAMGGQLHLPPSHAAKRALYALPGAKLWLQIKSKTPSSTIQ